MSKIQMRNELGINVTFVDSLVNFNRDASEIKMIQQRYIMNPYKTGGFFSPVSNG